MDNTSKIAAIRTRSRMRKESGSRHRLDRLEGEDIQRPASRVWSRPYPPHPVRPDSLLASDVLGQPSTHDPATDATWKSGVNRAIAILEAAIFEIQAEDSTVDEATVNDGSDGMILGAVDPDLWAKVSHLVAGGHWDQVVSQSAITFEHWVRVRSGLDISVYGIDLMKETFSQVGSCRLDTANHPRQKDGTCSREGRSWRNETRPVIDNRPDAQTYAMGSLGLFSLLMTQVRAEHPESVDLNPPANDRQPRRFFVQHLDMNAAQNGAMHGVLRPPVRRQGRFRPALGFQQYRDPPGDQ